MEKKTEPFQPDQWLKDLPTESQVRTFDAEAMIFCDECGRLSPPTRLKCLYCGANLQVSPEQSKHLRPSLRKLEEWEEGFNLILQNAAKLEDIDEITNLLRLERDDLQKIFEAKLPLPLARAETRTEAEVLNSKLNEAGIECKIVSDADLNLEKLPRRLRGLEFAEDQLLLILFNSDEVARVAYKDVNLVVTGAFFERRVEATQSLKKKDDKKILESREMSTDEMLIDIYSRTDSIGWRIEEKGFDFSGLGSAKAPFAKENMPKMLEKLKAVATDAKFKEDYLKVRAEIGKVWAISEKDDRRGLERKGIGGMKRTNITIISNLSQFTRYSRMHWHL